MIQFKFAVIPFLLLLAGCSSSLNRNMPVSDFYCDNFLIYDMCAQDLDQDGRVELVYFTDTNEVFLYRDGSEDSLPQGLSMHRCAQPMNDDIIHHTSRLFYLSDETSYLERSDIRSSLMMNYVVFLPSIALCTDGARGGSEEPIDEFDFELEF